MIYITEGLLSFGHIDKFTASTVSNCDPMRKHSKSSASAQSLVFLVLFLFFFPSFFYSRERREGKVRVGSYDPTYAFCTFEKHTKYGITRGNMK